MEAEYYQGELVRVGDSTVMAHPIGGKWVMYYIEFPIGEESEYRAALRKEDKRLVKVLPGLIVFEGE